MAISTKTPRLGIETMNSFYLILLLLISACSAQNATTLVAVDNGFSSITLLASATINPTPSSVLFGQTSTAASTINPTATPLTVPGSFNVRIAVLVLGAQYSEGIKSIVQSLDSYGIPFDVVNESNGIFSALSLEDANGKAYSEIAYNKIGGRYSVIVFADGYSYAYTPAVDAMLNAYQIKYGVRRVGFSMWPGSVAGIGLANNNAPGCCSAGQEQLLRWDATGLAQTNSGLNVDGVLTSQGLYHYPALITDPTTVIPLMYADAIPGLYAQSVLGVIQTSLDGRKNMFFFTSSSPYLASSTLMNHAWIGWSLKNLFPGYRRMILNTQVDDILLPNAVWNIATQVADGTTKFRIKSADLVAHAEWMKSLNGRLPSGSNYVIELGFNGNGVLGQVNSPLTVYYTSIQSGVEDYSFIKQNLTGSSFWPKDYPLSPPWNLTKLLTDEVFAYIASPAISQYFVVSHTFTHLSLNNASKSDVLNEIQFNQLMASSQFANLNIQPGFSSASLIPPSITGLLNGEALAVFAQQGINSVVGDNSRGLVNSQNKHWPLISTLAANGYDGFVILPRFATEVYFNVNTTALNLDEYNYIYASKIGVTTSYDTVLQREATRVVRNILLLQWDANMFHQSNMDFTTQPITNLSNGQSGQFSLLMTWVEFITTHLTALVNWPIVSFKQDTMYQKFMDRMQRDQCSYQMYVNVFNNTVLSATVSSTSECKVPVVVPQRVNTASENGKVLENLNANDLITYWTPLTGGVSSSFTWSTPFNWN